MRIPTDYPYKVLYQRTVKGWLRRPIFHYCRSCQAMTTNYREYRCGICGRADYKVSTNGKAPGDEMPEVPPHR